MREVAPRVESCWSNESANTDGRCARRRRPPVSVTGAQESGSAAQIAVTAERPELATSQRYVRRPDDARANRGTAPRVENDEADRHHDGCETVNRSASMPGGGAEPTPSTRADSHTPALRERGGRRAAAHRHQAADHWMHVR